MSQTNSDKDFKMTKEELDKFEKALKDEEFRKLLVQYAEEISDPENKKKYEEEITQMEKMRGMDVKFVNPEDGYVVKTTDCSNGVKAFINICSNQHIGKASSKYTEREENGIKKAGQQWYIPYSLSQPREDVDRAGNKCVVYDAVFHPDTYNKGQEDKRFKHLMIDTAIDGIQRQFIATLDKKNLKFPKMKFKGVKTATVIRTKTAQAPEESAELTIGGQKFPYPYSDEPAAVREEEKQPKAKNEEKPKKTASDPSVPEYRIVHRGHIDLQNFTHARDANVSTRPKELVIYINLPKLESAAPVDLDILEKQLLLNCKKPPYHLDLTLPYPVDEEKGAAKFDKSKRTLIVTLPVLPSRLPSIHIHSEKGDDREDQTELETAVVNSQSSVASSSTANGRDIAERGENVAQSDNSPEDLEDCSDVSVVAQSRQMQVESEVVEHNDIRFKLPNSSIGLSSPCFFTCPPYTYHQNNDVIVVIIRVPNIALDSVSLGFNKNKAYISFPSGTSRPGELPSPDFALYLQFPDDHCLDTELCNIDVSEENLVITLHKLDACKGLWESFQGGSGEDNLETKFFVTENTIDVMMKEIAEQDPWGAANGEASVKVSSLTEECLSLDVETTLIDSNVEELSGFHVETNTKHMGDSVSSCEEVTTDLADELRKTKLHSGGPEVSESSGKMCEIESANNQTKESAYCDPEMADSDEASTEKGDNFVPIDVITNAVRTRRSILRRTSSTSTDESLGDEGEFNGTPESPSKKNVRFNLNPNVRVFSNKKDKKKRKLEARLKAESRNHSLKSGESGSKQSNGTSPVDDGTGFNGFQEKARGNGIKERVNEAASEINRGNDKSTEAVGFVAGDNKSFGLSNNLIFQLDD